LKEQINNNEIEAAKYASYLAYKIRHPEDPSVGEAMEGIKKCLESKALHVVEFHKKYHKNDKRIISGGCIIETDNAIIIAFRGTSHSHRQEVWNDLKADKINVTFKKHDKSEESFEMHRGFKEEYNSIRDSFNKAILEINGQKGFTKPVICCGHSLGGALANIASLKLACNGEKNLKMITFGTPKVFSKDSADRVDELVPNSVRVIDAQDPAHLYPLFRLDYKHAGNLEIRHDAGKSLVAHAMPSSYMRYEHLSSTELPSNTPVVNQKQRANTI
jgi:hypothetical protein